MGFGVFVTLRDPTKSMKDFAREAGKIEIHGQRYDALQILTVKQILDGVDIG